MLKAVQLGGRAFLAGTSVDGAFALRACIVNPGLTAARVPGLLRDIRDRAADLPGPASQGRPGTACWPSAGESVPASAVASYVAGRTRRVLRRRRGVALAAR